MDAAKIAEFWFLSVSFTALQEKNKADPFRQLCCPSPRERLSACIISELLHWQLSMQFLSKEAFLNAISENSGLFKMGLSFWRAYTFENNFEVLINSRSGTAELNWISCKTEYTAEFCLACVAVGNTGRSYWRCIKIHAPISRQRLPNEWHILQRRNRQY